MSNSKESSEQFEALCQRHIADAAEQLDGAVAALDWSREEIMEHQTRRLRHVVQHAKRHSPYYRERLKRIDPDSLHASDLSSLPVCTKKEVMEHWDEFPTDPRLTLAAVTRHLQDLKEERKKNAYFLDRYCVAATGGTSGTRGVFVWDWELMTHVMTFAFRIERWHDRNRNVDDDAIVPTKRTALICASSFVHLSRFVWPMIPQLDPDRDVKHIPASLPLKQIVSQLNEFQPDRLYVYSSLVELLARAALDGELKVNLNYIMVGGEPLEESNRQAAVKAFGIDVHNAYASTEVGGISCDGVDFNGMIMSEDSMILELVNEKYEPCPDGDRMLITRLFGESFPLLRYEVTDMVVLAEPMHDGPGGAYRRILSVQGRVDTPFSYGDNVHVHPIVFRSVLVSCNEIIEYQVQQTEAGARTLVIAKGSVVGVASKIRHALISAGLEDPVVTVEVVDCLPRHPETDKIARFVNLKKQSTPQTFTLKKDE